MMKFTKNHREDQLYPQNQNSTNFFLILLIKFTTGKLWQIKPTLGGIKQTLKKRSFQRFKYWTVASGAPTCDLRAFVELPVPWNFTAGSGFFTIFYNFATTRVLFRLYSIAADPHFSQQMGLCIWEFLVMHWLDARVPPSKFDLFTPFWLGQIHSEGFTIQNTQNTWKFGVENRNTRLAVPPISL